MESEPLSSPNVEGQKVDISDMSAQQRRFCMAYLANGFSPMAAARTAGYADNIHLSKAANVVLNRPSVKYFLRKKVAEMTQELQITFEWKMQKLKKCVDTTIPDEGYANPDDMSPGLKAIDIMNKMQGDYAPINVHQASLNVNTEVDEARAKQLIDEFEKDY